MVRMPGLRGSFLHLPSSNSWLRSIQVTTRRCLACFLCCLFALTFALTAPASASHELLVRVFTKNPVEFPSSGLIADSSGNLFGVLEGAIYELSPRSSGGYTFRVIYSFGDAGAGASGNLVRDRSAIRRSWLQALITDQRNVVREPAGPIALQEFSLLETAQ